VFAGAASAQSERFEAARAMIERAQASGVFEPLEDDNVIMVRHAASGMVCLFSSDNRRAELMLFSSGLPRGDDVGCIRDSQDLWTTLYATRYAQPMSAEQALGEAVAGIQNRFQDAQRTPAIIQMSTESLPPLHVAHFFVTLEGDRWITSALVAQSGDWILKVRYTAPAPDEDAVRRHQLEASAMLAHALLRATAKQ
jgi:hypothetical protein